jgi:FolB domain-containing protein
MTQYHYCFSINRLRLAVRLGCEAPERKNPQPVEAEARVYFPTKPTCVTDDNGKFIDYAGLCSCISEVAEHAEFKLLEYLAGESFKALRRYLDDEGEKDAKLWLKLTKCAAPVAYLEGGASFVLTDLPAGASVVDAG